LIEVPIWAFHCRDDPAVSPTSVRDTVARLKELGGRAHLTEIGAASHDSWTPAFQDYYIMDWLLSHSRDNDRGYAPGEKPWRFWHLIPVPAIVIGLWLLWIGEKRRRTKVQLRALRAK
jgi:hypothetical protein